MRNIRLILEYDGTRYQGWQRLKNHPKAMTIQGKLEDVLSKMTGEDIQVIGSGRTDAGVHAYGQVANFHTQTKLSVEEIAKSLKKYLPQDIGVMQVEEVEERFHSRLNAKAKTYCYHLGKLGASHVFQRKYLWEMEDELDIKLMEEAAQYFIGIHDFKGFTSLKKTKKSTIREIYSIQLEEKNQEIHITFCGNGFLHHMVRILCGTLVEIGQKKRTPESILTVYQSKERADAGMMAPPQGLFLVDVKY